jgi:HSP20 family protein
MNFANLLENRFTPRMLETLLRGEQNLLSLPNLGASPAEAAYLPAVDVWEEKDRIVLKADLAGVVEEDLEVTLEGTSLRLCGRRELPLMEAGSLVLVRQRAAGQFSLTCTLPYSFEAKTCFAELKNGVLTLVFPKLEVASQARRIRLGAAGHRPKA